MSHDTLGESSAQARIAALLSSDLPSLTRLLGIALIQEPDATIARLATLTGMSERAVYLHKARLRADECINHRDPARGAPPLHVVHPDPARGAPPPAPDAGKQRSKSPPIYPPFTTSTDRNNQADRYSNNRNNFWANLNPDYNQASQAVWWDDLGRLQVANGFRAELITTVGGEANLRQALDEAAAYVETRFVGLDLMKRVRGRITQQLRWKAEQAKRHPPTETQAERMARIKAAFDAAPSTDAWS